METTILADERPILAIHSSAIDSADFEVGEFGVTLIEKYGEPAMHCDIPWFRIYKGDEICARVCAHHIALVRYA